MERISGETELHATILGFGDGGGYQSCLQNTMALPMSSRFLSTTDIKKHRARFLALHVIGELHRMHAIETHNHP